MSLARRKLLLQRIEDNKITFVHSAWCSIKIIIVFWSDPLSTFYNLEADEISNRCAFIFMDSSRPVFHLIWVKKLVSDVTWSLLEAAEIMMLLGNLPSAVSQESLVGGTFLSLVTKSIGKWEKGEREGWTCRLIAVTSLHGKLSRSHSV